MIGALFRLLARLTRKRTSPAMRTGSLRFRVIPPDHDVPTIADDGIFEVLGADGEWIQLKGLCAFHVRLDPGEIANATLSVELTMLEGLVPPEATAWRRLPLEKRA
jgi:hypothetical protein